MTVQHSTGQCLPKPVCPHWVLFVGRQEMVWSEITVTLQDELIEAGTPVEFQFPPLKTP